MLLFIDSLHDFIDTDGTTGDNDLGLVLRYICLSTQVKKISNGCWMSLRRRVKKMIAVNLIIIY